MKTTQLAQARIVLAVAVASGLGLLGFRVGDSASVLQVLAAYAGAVASTALLSMRLRRQRTTGFVWLTLAVALAISWAAIAGRAHGYEFVCIGLVAGVAMGGILVAPPSRLSARARRFRLVMLFLLAAGVAIAIMNNQAHSPFAYDQLFVSACFFAGAYFLYRDIPGLGRLVASGGIVLLACTVVQPWVSFDLATIGQFGGFVVLAVATYRYREDVSALLN